MATFVQCAAALADRPVSISAIVPVKNGSAYLSECLDSILEQLLYPEFTVEVSVYDDGSTDDTASIVSRYRSRFLEKRIAFISGGSERSGGVGYAKNRSVQQCNGSVLIFCDADDISSKRRFVSLYNALCNATKPDLTVVGSKFDRIPTGSTSRYTQWANSLNSEQVTTQIFTSHGPSLVAPTWCVSRKLYDRVGGFRETQSVGYPEDLRFFYDAVKLGAEFIKVEESLLSYRYHPKCTSLLVPEDMIWTMRVAMFEELVLVKWEKFMVWGAGKIGRRFYKTLNAENRQKVTAFCDIDEKKLQCARYEHFDPEQRRVVATVPIISLSEMIPPVAVCLKMDFIDSEEVNKVFKSHIMVEGRDYFYLG